MTRKTLDKHSVIHLTSKYILFNNYLSLFAGQYFSGNNTAKVSLTANFLNVSVLKGLKKERNSFIE